MSMETRLVVAHELSLSEDGTLSSAQSSFDVTTYSRMKFGDARATQMLADILTPELIRSAPELTEAPEEPFFAVAYKAVPPACFYLSRNCLASINEARVRNNLRPGRIIQAYKDRVTATNYASSSYADRQRELAAIGFSFEGRDISQNPVAVLDDVRITGSAEKRMIELIEPERTPLLVLGYVALLDPESAVKHPSVEHDMNSAFVKDIYDIADIISDGAFDLNIRTLKLILGSGVSDIQCFLEQVDPSVAEQLYQGAVATGPEFVSQYEEGFAYLRKVVQHIRSNA